MAQRVPQIPTAQVVSVMGVTVNRAHESLLRSVIRYSGAISVLMVLYVIGSIISYLSNEEPITANQWISLLLFFCLCGVSVPLTGYYGAKQKDANKLQMFAFGEGCVSCCSFMTILTTFYSMGAIVAYCQTDACQEQFSNGTTTCITYTRSDATSRNSRGSASRVEIAKDLCDDPYGYWYIWYVAIFLGIMGIVSGIATCKGIELKNRLQGSISPRDLNRLGGPVATRVMRVHNNPNRNVPALPPTMMQGVIVQPGSVQMVPMVTQPVTVVAAGEHKTSQPVLVPIYKNGDGQV